MLSIINTFLFIIYYSKLSSSLISDNKSISTTSYPVILQIPSPPTFLQTNTKTTIVNLNNEQVNVNLPLKFEPINYSKQKSLIAVILSTHMKVKPLVFNIDQSPRFLLFSSVDKRYFDHIHIDNS